MTDGQKQDDTDGKDQAPQPPVETETSGAGYGNNAGAQDEPQQE